MGKFRVEVTELAKLQIAKHIKSGNQASIKKIGKILLELTENALFRCWKTWTIKHNLSGLWSREINSKDRLIYEVKEDLVIVDVISAMGHYNDK